ncbi:DUF2796 domain-containing protein [Nisaea acidiphila]|uniref:DUF2796 domain-containing protein n=1 Tax=Nisaea acidiphila TaxID=1862145 RepID=A0A9J7AQ94_9PROT|nr:DUF2796 domain-containing protein [Nisaea acidiphila]UUX49779.1 DUF2796 domain-containing protein [Nisaea acidiphila]
MIRKAAAALFLFGTVSVPAVHASETRSAHAHEHGHGTLNIAFEDNRVLMELEIPGADIVGFEHEPKSDSDKAAVEAAEEKLKNGVALFRFDGTACRFEEAHLEDHHEEHAKNESHDHEEGEHSEFHVAYELSCDDTARISGMAFPFFAAFPNSEELEVTIIGTSGQFHYEVERDEPNISLKK